VHLSIFISVFNQLDEQNLFHNKFYFMPLHVSSTCAHHQEVKITLHSLWYHHTYRWPSRARDQITHFHVTERSCVITKKVKPVAHYSKNNSPCPQRRFPMIRREAGGLVTRFTRVHSLRRVNKVDKWWSSTELCNVSLTLQSPCAFVIQ